MVPEQLVSMIQSGAVDRRRTSGVFGGAKDDDGGGRMQFIPASLPHDPHTGNREPTQHKQRESQEQSRN
jgi:hypothetical protein